MATNILNPQSSLPKSVQLTKQLRLEGNIVPHNFHYYIKTPSGKTDLPAIMILVEIIYWYLPLDEWDEGAPKQRKKFSGDMFQCNLTYFINRLGLTEQQVRNALDNLEKNRLIRREIVNNVTFVEPIPQKIAEIINKTTDNDDQNVLDNFSIDYYNVLLEPLKRIFGESQIQKRDLLSKEFSENELSGLVKAGFLEHCTNPNYLQLCRRTKLEIN